MANIMHEDAVMKMGVEYFRDTISKLLGVNYHFLEPGSTELVALTIQKMYLDYTFPTLEGPVIHFEFQTTDSDAKDLRRFHAYEAVYQNNTGKTVLTYVIYTNGITKARTSLNCGLYTYRVHPIYFAEKKADDIITRLKQKQKDKSDFSDDDFVQLALSPLMSSDSSRKEVIKDAVLLMKPYNHMSAQKALAMLYALADKFLNRKDLDEFKEVVAMTRVGQMLFDDGLKAGKSQGIQAVVETCRELNVDFEETIQKVKLHFDLSEDEARDAVTRLWK